jgi:hypothetical protein
MKDKCEKKENSKAFISIPTSLVSRARLFATLSPPRPPWLPSASPPGRRRQLSRPPHLSPPARQAPALASAPSPPESPPPPRPMDWPSSRGTPMRALKSPVAPRPPRGRPTRSSLRTTSRRRCAALVRLISVLHARLDFLRFLVDSVLANVKSGAVKTNFNTLAK